MNKSILVTIFCLAMSGCVKFEIQPDIVSGTIDAGKDLYQAAKRKSTGASERAFNHSIALKQADNETDKMISCITHLKQVAQEASSRDAEILSESTEIADVDGVRTIKCSVSAVI
jgi:hypothetical protein